MRKGLHEVLPGSCFSGLSAEDFRLLLCGCPHIDVDVVRGITLFHDESRELIFVCISLNQDIYSGQYSFADSARLINMEC